MFSKFLHGGLLVIFLFLGSGTPCAAQPPSRVAVSGKPISEPIAPGRAVDAAIVLDIESGWHIYASDAIAPEGSDVFVNQTRVALESEGVEVLSVDWPHAHAWQTGDYTVDTYQGSIEVYVRLLVPEDAPLGTNTITLNVFFQACSDQTCSFPRALPVEFAITVDPNGGGIVPDDSGVIPDPGDSTDGADDGNSLEFSVLGFIVSGLAAAVILGFMGGFLLNLMPCVLPLLPIKIMSLEKSLGSFTRRLLYGFMIMLGAIAFMMTLGLIVSLIKGIDTTSALFQSPFFTIGVGLFCGIMGFSMMRGKTLPLPNSVQAFNPLETTTLKGAFLYGVLQTVLATACGAPLLGTGLAWALQQGSVLIVLTVFLAAGLGMGLPWLILTAFPKLVSWMPKAGPWSDLMKQVMGMLMLASAFFFLGAGILSTGVLAETHYLLKVFHLWLVAITLATASLWTIYVMWRLKTPLLRFSICALLALGVASTSMNVVWKLTVAEHALAEGSSVWQPFDRAAFEQAQEDGKVIVVDFTADWCINCKVMEHRVLNDDGVRQFLEDHDVVTFKADITQRSGAAQDFMNEHWQGPPPLLAVFGPGLESDKPLLSDRGATETIDSFKSYVLKASSTSR